MKVTKDTVNKDMDKPMGKPKGNEDVVDEGIDLMDFIVSWHWPYPKVVYGELDSSTYDDVGVADEFDKLSKESYCDLMDLIERNRNIAGY